MDEVQFHQPYVQNKGHDVNPFVHECVCDYVVDERYGVCLYEYGYNVYQGGT